MTDYVLVHGGFVGGEYWADTAALLEKAGHRVEVVAQLSSSGPAAASGSLAEDVRITREIVEGVGGPVVLVGHSAAGFVLTELGDHPQVAHSVYVSAFWPERGQSMVDLLMATGEPPPWLEPLEDGTARFVDDLEVRHRLLCADAELDRVADALRAMTPVSMSAAATPSTAPDRTHPVTFVVCELDQVAPVALQEQMAAKADHVERLPSSHQPMTSMPDRLAEVLGRITVG